MVPLEEERAAGQNDNESFFEKLPDSWLDGNKIETVKGSQFLTPLFEFSGACAGCGETPYNQTSYAAFWSPNDHR